MKEQTRRRSSRNSKQNAESTPPHTGRSRSASANENISHRRSAKTTTPVNVQSTQRKRKRSVSSVERPKVLKKMVDGRVVDQYCWVCHKFGYDSTCLSCPRVYHKNCLKKLKGSSNQPLSCECCMKRVDGKSEDLDLNKDQLQKLLQYVMQEAIKDSKKNNHKSRKSENIFCRLFQTWPIENETLCKIMDLDILLDRMNGETEYSSTGEFFLDVKWIYHNCCISYGSDSEMAETAVKMEKNFKLELTDLEACTECYRNKYLYTDSFTKVCRNDHKIIWAKLRGSPYWPAKLLSIHNGHADVRFFGTHDKANILSKKCFEISEEAPFNKEIKQPKYRDAVHELLIYVHNYQNLKGDFTYFERNTPLEDDTPHAKKPLHQRGQNNNNNAEQVSRNESSSGNSGTQEEQDSLTKSAGSGTSEDIREHPFPNDTEVKCIRNFVDNGNQNTESIESHNSNGSKMLYQCMFSDDGPASDLNNADEFMDSSSYNTVSQASFNRNFPLSSVNGASFPSTSFLPSNSVDIFNTDPSCVIACAVPSNKFPLDALSVIPSIISSNADSSNTISADLNTLSKLPVITSTISECENEDYAAKIIPVMHENPKVSMNDSYTDNSSIHEQFTNLINETNVNCVSEDDSEEIEIIGEDYKTSPAYKFMKNPEILKALIEVLVGNRPQIKAQFRKFTGLMLESYLSVWIEMSKFDKNDIHMFGQICRKYVKAIDNEKMVNAGLKNQLKVFQDKVESLEETLREKIALTDSIVETAVQRIQHKNETKVVTMYEEKLKKLQAKLEDREISKQLLEQENKCLKMRLNEAKQKIETDEEELSALRDIVEVRQGNLNLKRVQQNSEIVCTASSETEETHHDCPEREFHKPVIAQNQDSALIIKNNVPTFGILPQVPTPVTSPQVPHLLDSDSSSKYLKAISTSRSKGVRNIQTKTSGKRKKNNI